MHPIHFLHLRSKERTKKHNFNMFKIIVICGCLLAVAQAGVVPGSLLSGPSAIALGPTSVAVPAISTSNIIRGIGNLGELTAFSKSVDTPFSSVRKADVRINNPDILTAVSAPALAVANTAYAAPIGATYGHAGLIAAPGLTAGIGHLGLGGHLGVGTPLGLGHLKVLG